VGGVETTVMRVLWLRCSVDDYWLMGKMNVFACYCEWCIDVCWEKGALCVISEGLKNNDCVAVYSSLWFRIFASWVY
jgi:hypothetical protein